MQYQKLEYLMGVNIEFLLEHYDWYAWGRTWEDIKTLFEKVTQRNKQIKHLKEALELKRSELRGCAAASEGIIDTKNNRILELENIVEELGILGFERTVPRKSEEKGQLKFDFKEGSAS